MNILVDIIIVGAIALCTFLGYKQGLIKSAIKILSFFIAIIVALALYKPVSSLVINNTDIDNRIQSSIIQRILPEGAKPEDEVQVDKSISNIIRNVAEPTVNEVARAITVQIIETGALLIIFIVVKIALKFITVLADIIAKIPILKQLNEVRRNYIWISKRNNHHIRNSCNNITYISNDRKKLYRCY